MSRRSALAAFLMAIGALALGAPAVLGQSSEGATITRFNDCPYVNDPFVGTICYDSIFVANSTVTPAGRYSLTYNGHGTVTQTLGDCTYSSSDNGGFHGSGTFEEGNDVELVRQRLELVTACGDTRIVCESTLYVHAANGQLQFDRRDEVCTASRTS